MSPLRCGLNRCLVLTITFSPFQFFSWYSNHPPDLITVSSAHLYHSLDFRISIFLPIAFWKPLICHECARIYFLHVSFNPNFRSSNLGDNSSLNNYLISLEITLRFWPSRLQILSYGTALDKFFVFPLWSIICLRLILRNQCICTVFIIWKSILWLLWTNIFSVASKVLAVNFDSTWS